MSLKYAFAYMDNPKKVKSKNFKKLLNRLNKPLFTLKEQGLI